jgi:hypothetical protein
MAVAGPKIGDAPDPIRPNALVIDGRGAIAGL